MHSLFVSIEHNMQDVKWLGENQKIMYSVNEDVVLVILIINLGDTY